MIKHYHHDFRSHSVTPSNNSFSTIVHTDITISAIRQTLALAQQWKRSHKLAITIVYTFFPLMTFILSKAKQAHGLEL